MRRLGVLALIALLAPGCLPGDDRPEPGNVLVNVRRSAPAVEGLVTDDDWHIRFDRFVMGIGDMGLDGDDCSDYSRASYMRLYDFAVADTSKASLHYGLGPCTIEFDVRAPSERAILMAGVTEADRELMAPEPSGMFHHDDDTEIAIMIKGRAERESETKDFSWLIRHHQRVGVCRTPSGEQDLSAIELRAGDAVVRELEVRPAELFRLTPSVEARIEFGRIANADADGDGTVTQEELAKVPLSFEEIAADLADEVPDWSPDRIAELIGDASLARLVFDILPLRVAAFAGAGECEAGKRDWF